MTHRILRFSVAATFAGLLALGQAIPGQAETVVQITVENIGSAGGTALTPVFAGFHDGSYNLFDVGSSASAELERVAEDGNTAPLVNAFTTGTRVSRVIGGLTGPGQSAMAGNVLISVDGANRFLTLATMVVPTNDFFIGNSNPLAFDLMSLDGAANGTSLVFDLTNVYDAGTEVNDFATSAANFLFTELPAGQTGPNQGVDENGNIVLVTGDDPFASFAGVPTGFNPGLAGLRVTITAIPEPSTMATLSLIGIGLVVARRFRKQPAQAPI